MSRPPGRARRVWAPWRRSLSFAERLVARRARLAGGGAPPVRVLLRAPTRRPAPGTTRVELRVAVGLALGRGAPPPRGGYVAPRVGTVPESSRGGRSRAPAASLAERVVARATRLDRVPGPQAARGAGAAPPPVARVVRRGAPPGDETQRRAASRATGVGVEAAWPASTPRIHPRPHPGDAGPALSARELDRVTTHVVDALDRRLAAFRERRGRG